MAKSKKTEEPGAGHNHVLSDQEIADLQLWYERKIRAQEKIAATKKAEYDAERTEVNNLFAKLKGDLQIKRKDFEEMMAAADLSEAEFRVQETKRTKLFANRGLPVGTQLALDLGADTVTDQQMAEADGRRAFNRSDDRIPPDYVSPVMHPDWLRGYDAEMDIVAQRMGRAEAILAAREEAPADDAKDGGDEPAEPEVDLSEEAVAAAARRVRRSDFMARGTSKDADQPAAA